MCRKTRNKHKAKCISHFQLSRMRLLPGENMHSLSKLSSQKLCCSVSWVLKYCRMDDLKAKQIHFWVAVEQYLCSAIITSWYQSALMVGTPRKTCDFSCVPRQSSKRLCYCQRTFWSVLWKKNENDKVWLAIQTRNRAKQDAKTWNIICNLLPTTLFRLCT